MCGNGGFALQWQISDIEGGNIYDGEIQIILEAITFLLQRDGSIRAASAEAPGPGCW